MIELTVQEEQTLKSFTDNNYAQGSFFWAYLIKNKEIRVNGKKVDLQPLDQIHIPDPVQLELDTLNKKLKELEAKIKE